MQHAVVMTVRNSSQKLEKKRSGNCAIKTTLANIEVLLQVLVKILENKSQLSLSVDNIIEPKIE